MSRRTRNRERFIAKYGAAALGHQPPSEAVDTVQPIPEKIEVTPAMRRRGGWPLGKPRKPVPVDGPDA